MLKRGFEVERDKGVVLNHEDQPAVKRALRVHVVPLPGKRNSSMSGKVP